MFYGNDFFPRGCALSPPPSPRDFRPRVKKGFVLYYANSVVGAPPFDYFFFALVVSYYCNNVVVPDIIPVWVLV